MAKVVEHLQSPQTLFLMGVVGLVLAYAMATRAIDTGSLGQYGLTFLLLFLSINVFIRAGRSFKNDKQ